MLPIDATDRHYRLSWKLAFGKLLERIGKDGTIDATDLLTQILVEKGASGGWFCEGFEWRFGI